MDCRSQVLNAEYYAPRVDTVVDLLSYRALSQPQTVAYTVLANGEDESEHVTYSDLDAAARSLALQLSRSYLPGDRALVLLPTSVNFLVAYFGAMYAGLIPVPVSPAFSKTVEKLLPIINDCKPNVTLTHEGFTKKIPTCTIRPTCLNPENLIIVDRFASQGTSVWKRPEVSGQSTAFLQYTSGSTAFPKGVMISHENVMYNERMIKHAFGHSSDTVFVGWLPLYHDMGLIGNVLQPLYLGIHCVLMPPLTFVQKPIRWLKAVSRYSATTSGGPNFAYELCFHKIREDQCSELDLTAWKVAFNGSEPVRASTIRDFTNRFDRYGFKVSSFYPCYGMAEASLLISGGEPQREPLVITSRDIETADITYTPTSGRSQEYVSNGRAWLDEEVRIVDPETETPCDDGMIGEVWVSGKNVASGYYNNTEETRRTFCNRLQKSDGNEYLLFMRTGDLGFIRDRNLFITGRLKDVIIIRGRNISPYEIEHEVSKISPCFLRNAAAAFSSGNDFGEERLILVQEIERSSLRSFNGPKCKEIVRERIVEDFGVEPLDVIFVRKGSIPKTSSGKVRRAKCRSMYRQNEFEKL